MANNFHQPVLLSDFLKHTECLHPIYNYLDCTFGRGGHAAHVLERNPDAKLYAFDRDLQALEFGNTEFRSHFPKREIEFIHGNFMKDDLPAVGLLDLILADLGVSSPQYDQAERGFSFYHDGPLDMRMDPSVGQTAAEIINEYSEDELIELFKQWGELRSPFRVVRAIVHDRKETPFESTRQLAGLIERVDGWKKKGSHPATKYFMALRLVVNEEIDPLGPALESLVAALRPGGRLCIMTFHSMEDRIVKFKFREMKDLGKIITKKPIQASKEEVHENPRSRTAKLRIFEKATMDEQ